MMYKPRWSASAHPARLWQETEEGRVVCRLSPRNCKIRDGQAGFCGVRMNDGGRLVTLNYGRATELTEETIETEAVFHFAPGAPILSLGNIGCMLKCDYCHNWRTSQAREVEATEVHRYTPEEVVDHALARSIPVLSWTYNDPVVWHEFVLDAARLGRERGLVNLYKSAFFITPEAVEELCEVIDIFSVSIKSMDPTFYRKISKGWLEPVLEATRQVYERGKHLEVSNLMVTDANDTEEDARKLAEWVIDELDATVPVHFVRFHPDYKYTHVGRTPIERLARAREAALEVGLEHCYLGNVYGHAGVDTVCLGCGETLVERFGLNTRVRGLDLSGSCAGCGRDAHFRALGVVAGVRQGPSDPAAIPPGVLAGERQVVWNGEINACHIVATNATTEDLPIGYLRQVNGRVEGPVVRQVRGGGSERFIVSRASEDEAGIVIRHPEQLRVRAMPVLDRAYYPTTAAEDLAR